MDIGPVETSVTAGAARLTIALRVVVAGWCTALLPLGAPLATSLAIVAAAVAWQAAFLAATRLGRRPAALVTAADGVLLGALCVLLPVWSLPHGYLDLDDWARQVTSIVGVTVQWYTRPLGGAATTLGLAAAVVAGALLVTGDDRLGGLNLPAPDWNLGADHAIVMLWQGALSRCLAWLVARGGRRVDELAAAVTAGRREAQVAAARRADVEVHMAQLHDTVAATLTAACSPGVGGTGLRDRARADLARLSVQTWPGADLTAVPAGLTLRVTTVLDGPGGPGAWAEAMGAVPAEAAAALAAARDEALRNVERHAGTGAAVVELHRPPGGGLRIDIVDEGPGFDPATVDPDRFGVRVSIGARMRRAGGRATVDSAPGRGTRVSLQWPDRGGAWNG
ncbi:ATP-binding protein [Dactylosporangium sp. NPDC051541]|uniref:ATP-binding protein n=1 Tax=Dactylosporangium sp. NPDC051541 TaxID=3363977 RepID=UPI0037B7C385